MPGSHLEYAPDAGPDARCYRVNFAKIHRVVPGFTPEWTLEKGIEQLSRAFRDYGLSLSDFQGPRFVRIQRIQQLIHREQLDRNLRWIPNYAHA